MEQNFKNHSRYIPAYHIIAPIILLILFIAAALHVIQAVKEGEEWHHPTLLLLGTIALLIMWWYVRAFPVRAQDRIIMLEERLRHQQLTGKPIPANLRPPQIIALRFASDAEFPSLAEKAAAENMSSKQIKEAIKIWRADNYRV